MPASVLGLALAGFTARITRAMVLEALRQDATIRQPTTTVIVGHAIRKRTAANRHYHGPPGARNLLGGAAVTETVFSWLARQALAIDSTTYAIFPPFRRVVLLLATTHVVVNLTVDVLYNFIDPRIRYGVASAT